MKVVALRGILKLDWLKKGLNTKQNLLGLFQQTMVMHPVTNQNQAVALGLGKNSSVIKEDNPAARGMTTAVSHLQQLTSKIIYL